jgi:AraC-like DNA-binding protein
VLGPALEAPILGGRTASLVEGWWWRPVTGAGTVIPDGVVDVMWCDGVGPWLAGPDTGPRTTGLAVGGRVVGLRLRTGVATAVLGDAVDRATDRSVPLAEVWSRDEIERLEGDLAEARSMADTAAALGAAIDRHVPAGWEPDHLVVAAIDALRRGRVVDTGSVGDRQFRRRFIGSVGYGPALYRRVARLERFTDLRVRERHRTLAELAADVGYADESHLWRDCTALTGSTPARLATS